MKRLLWPLRPSIFYIVILTLLLAQSQLFDVKRLAAVGHRSNANPEVEVSSAAAADTTDLQAWEGSGPCPIRYASEHQRIGFNFDRSAGQPLESYDYSQLNAGWYHDYGRQLAPPDDVNYYQMIRPRVDTTTLTRTVGSVVDANLGAIWFVGNEPDKRDGQDNQTPAEYAVFYHDVYTFLKDRDPSAQVAIAGIVQATPIRLAYLDAVLDEYQSRYGHSLPVDIMTVHGFILCEVCEWGAGLPPGMEDSAALGRNYEVSQHIDFDIFKEQIVAMRQWMADRGYREKPLIVNEYGVLMPVTFEGFGYRDVRDFMLNSFDYLRTATDEQIGYAADGGRLVQEFAWFSLNSEPYNEETFEGFNGELFVHNTGEITQWGRDFAQYVAPLVQQTDVVVDNITLSPGLVALESTSSSDGTTTAPVGSPSEIDVAITLENEGQLSAYGTTVKLWLGEPDNGGTLLGETTLTDAIAANPTAKPTVTFSWSPSALELGATELLVEIEVDSCNPERIDNGNQLRTQLMVVNEADLRGVYLPIIQ